MPKKTLVPIRCHFLGFVMAGLSVSPSPNNSRSPSPLAWRKRDRYYRSPDRHRDHLRRRRSRSHSHRHRRRSPSPRYKRSRRDYDDRRHGSDYRGRYERGGREDRYYGRRSDRRSDSPDSWSVSSEDSSNAGGTQRVGLMSYKQFILELEDDILPAEAEHRYEEYKLEYITAQKRAYFEAHKDDDWLREKYHPTNLVTVIQRRDWKARTSAKEFFLDLQSGALDVGPGLTAATLNNSEQEAHKNSYDEADINGRRQKHIHGPPDTGDGVSSAPRAPPVSSEPRRIQIDVVQAQDLVRKLDSEKGIKDNILCNSDNGEQSHTGFTGPIVIIRGLKSVKGLEGEELLDTLVTYLWRVHHLDYYGMSEKTDAKGLRHVRSEIKTADESDPAGVDWEKKLDLFWQERLCGQDPLEIMLAKEKLDVAAVAAFNPIVRKIEDEKFGLKYGCGAKGCSKIFHGAEYVHKHLKLKHPDLVVALTSQVREDLYFQNYMNDANAPGGTPLLQRSAPDKVIRHSQVSDRLRDERGNYRERDRNDRFTDAERYTRSEGSPFGNPTGGLNTSKSDELMHDAYGGRGLADTYFPSDAPPPPVLMPVPGAGPLGPFVPAPPEVANRLLKEQGVPTLNGGPHGRKGRPGPQMGGSMPILAVAPAMGHDPRQIRSYRDLDVPNEEVKVIDYRSLV